LARINDEAGGAERKGLIYEIFVALAVESAFGSLPQIAPALKGVIADQDIVWPGAAAPSLIISVTHWGGHAAANKKFWRVHEDLYESFQSYPNAIFGSVVFDRDPNSDENLCLLLEGMTAGVGISDLNFPAIRDLQLEVSTAELQRRFGSGQEMLPRAKSIMKLDKTFRDNVTALGRFIKIRAAKHKRSTELTSILTRATSSKSPVFRDPGRNIAYFKLALVALLDIGADLNTIFEHADRKSWNDLPLELESRLVANGCLEEQDGLLDVEYKPTVILRQLIDQGLTWCEEQLALLQSIASDTDHPLYAFHDQLEDVIDSAGCKKRLDVLLSIKNATELYELLREWNHGMNRCWPIDYMLAIQRENPGGRNFGFPKLSQLLGVNHIGGISPLPKYASGDTRSLDAVAIKKLAGILFKLLKSSGPQATTVKVIQKNRRTTLMKKFSVLDACAIQKLKILMPGADVKGASSVSHPLRALCGNQRAGSTDFNIIISANGKRAVIFIAAVYETTHKHKEVSGRLRTARSTGRITSSDLCLLLIDGNFLADDARGQRIQMMKDAGWGGAYFLNEINQMAEHISVHLGC
jgi:hypothetical protein